MELIEHLQKKGLKYVFNLDRLKGFFSAMFHKTTGIKLKPEEVQSYTEQFLLRQHLCRPCVEKGSCLHCGCAITGLTTEKNNTRCGYSYKDEETGEEIEAPRWEDMLPPNEWEDYKEKALKGVGFGVFVKK